MIVHGIFSRHIFVDWGSLWSFLSVAGTFLLAYIGWKQFRKLNKTSKEEFVHKLKKDFFTKEARELFTLIENNALFLVDIPNYGDYKVFEIRIDNNLIEYLRDSINVKRNYYSTEEIDDFLLQHFEDIGLLYKNKIIEIEDVDQQFECYIKVTFENEQITDYIKWARESSKDKDIYSNFEMIYKEVENYEKSLKSNDF